MAASGFRYINSSKDNDEGDTESRCIYTVSKIISEGRVREKIRKYVNKGFKLVNLKLGYYPFWLVIFKVEIQRFIFKPLTMIVPVTVDGITGKAEISYFKIKDESEIDGIERIEVSERQKLNPSISLDEALERARDILNFYITTRAIPKRMKVEILKTIVLHRPYWIALLKAEDSKEDKKIIVVNAISGEVMEMEGEEYNG